jgi:hypothetical protein
MELFSEWLLGESLEYGPEAEPISLRRDHTAEPIEPPDHYKFKEFCRQILIGYFGADYKNAMARYDFVIEGVRETWGEVIISFQIVPKGKHELKDRWMEFKTAKDAIDAIPDNPQWVYRGMSWEEWQYIRKKGHVQSKGAYNIGQEGLTFYGNAKTGLYYGSSLAPIPFKTSMKRPSVVIAIPRKFVMDHEDLPNKIPGGEFAHRGPINASEIVGAWMLSPTRAKAGSIDFYFEFRRKEGEEGFVPGKIREGSRSNPTVSYVLRTLQ